MNRLLSLPFTRITPAHLDALQQQHHSTLVTERGTIQLSHRLGVVELKFLVTSELLPAGTAVCVWWKGGGFVCATEDELSAQVKDAQRVAQQVAQAREHLAAARRQRDARESARHSNIDNPVSVF